MHSLSKVSTFVRFETWSTSNFLIIFWETVVNVSWAILTTQEKMSNKTNNLSEVIFKDFNLNNHVAQTGEFQLMINEFLIFHSS